LKGTGDRNTTVFTSQAIGNMLQRYGINDPSKYIRVRNVAAVMVTADLPAFAKKGDRIDLVVSSMGDARSLDGGVLLQTTLKGLDDKVYVVGQGAISTGGDSMNVAGTMASRKKVTVGRVPEGGLVEKEVPVTFVDEKNDVYLQLRQPNFTTAARIADEINSQFWGDISNAIDANTVKINVPFDFRNNTVEFVAAIEGMYIEIEENSFKVVVNERTGTVVMGADVVIDTCSVAHGNYNVNININKESNQPNVFVPGASMHEYSHSTIEVEGGGNQLVTLPQGVDVMELVNALNVLGASPMDIISILQAIKAAGALHAEIEIL
ncbi:MAG: flagellar basal body P-ring protein FlgI, partial [bacterium]